MGPFTAAMAPDGSVTPALEAVYRRVADAHQRLAFSPDFGPDDKAECLADLLAAMDGLEPFLPPLGGERERRAG
jgi:hypothetical protein